MPSLDEEALQAMAGLPDEDPAGDRLVLGGVLADDEHARGAVEPPAVEDRAPFEAKAVGGVGDGAGVAGDERGEGLLAVAGIEGGGHAPSPTPGGLARSTRPAAAPRRRGGSRSIDRVRRAPRAVRSFATWGTAAKAARPAGARSRTHLLALRARSGQRDVVDVGLDGGVDARASSTL